MANLINFQILELPELLVVGKSMEGDMAGENKCPAFWGECFAQNVFAPLEGQAEFVYDGSYVGWMGDWIDNNGKFLYICGMLMKPGCAVPAGYTAHPLPAQRVAVGWIQDVEGPELFMNAHPLTEEALKARGLHCEKMNWTMEVYACPRFTSPDENGRVVLDYYIPLDA